MRLRFPPLFLVLSLLAGCASGPAAVFNTFQTSLDSRRAADKAVLDPAYRYLRVTVDGRAALMVLGDIEPDPAGPIEVWYSSQREVIRLQNGRIKGAVGLTTEWRRVHLPPRPALPAWSALVAHNTTLNWSRQRDVMPGYHYGIEDSLTLAPISAPSRSALSGLAAESLQWFEETTVLPAQSLSIWREAPAHLDLPPARYALDPRQPDVVVYGEQCLARELCFSWQRWPADSGANSGPKPATATP